MESIPGDLARATANLIFARAKACVKDYKTLGNVIRPEIHDWLQKELVFAAGLVNGENATVHECFNMCALISSIHERHKISRSVAIKFIENELSSTMYEAAQHAGALHMEFDHANDILAVTARADAPPALRDGCLLVPPTAAAKAAVQHDGGALSPRLPRPDLDRMPATPVAHRSPPPAPHPKRARSNLDFTSDDDK